MLCLLKCVNKKEKKEKKEENARQDTLVFSSGSKKTLNIFEGY